jgi:7-cyano-7-deazaguanine synthase in queuosine biosynthesis
VKEEILVHARVGRERLPKHLGERFRVITVQLSPDRHSGHFNTGAHGLRHLCGQGWDVQSFDLLNIMCGLRAADRYLTSGGLFHARRTIRLAVGVSDAQCWRNLRAPLSSTVRALSDDTLHFYPIRLPELPLHAFPATAATIGQPTPSKADCVCLFSGGADSFAGVAHLLAHRRNALLVSQSVGPVSGIQKRLFMSLRERFPRLAQDQLIQMQTHPNIARIEHEARPTHPYWQSRDSLQRLRSMFFLSLAGIAARARAIDEIFMCENGLVGAAIVFAPIDDSPYTTRPAEPHFLRAMQGFLRFALDQPLLAIRNPFQYMTKGQVLSHAASLDLLEPLHRTVSCWRSGNCGVRNCGACVPCLFRQLAFDEARLPAPPRSRAYRFPIPRSRWQRWNSTELPRLEDIRQYCQEVVRGGMPGLMGNELAVTDAVDVTGGPVHGPPALDTLSLDEAAPRKTARVILRFARAVLERLQ